MVEKIINIPTPGRQEDRFTRYRRAVAEGERIERESARQHDAHMRR